MIITLFLALVASVAGDIIRGPSVTKDTYIMSGSNTNYNTLTTGGWDGPFSISGTVISGVTSATQALLIKFDLSSFVGATLVPASPVWFYYLVFDVGDTASLRELTVPWNDVCTSPAKTHAPLTTACGTLAETPSRGRRSVTNLSRLVSYAVLTTAIISVPAFRRIPYMYLSHCAG